jgi:hypothetical protein
MDIVALMAMLLFFAALAALTAAFGADTRDADDWVRH